MCSSDLSTLAAAVAGILRESCSVAVVPTDHFATWDDPVSWWPRLRSGVLEPLRDGRSGAYQPMDWSGPAPVVGKSTSSVPISDILIVEGVSAGRVSVRPWLTCLVWVDYGDVPARLARSVARDGVGSRSAFEAWQRFEAGWFAVDRTRAAATLTFTG